MVSRIKTAEAVCVGHPDKLCDLIADQILDDILVVDKAAHVAVEVLAAGKTITVAGEITTHTRPNIRASVTKALGRAGYGGQRFKIRTQIRRQSEQINTGVRTSLEAREGNHDTFALQGAGDQGTVYGYATSESTVGLPLPLVLAHEICEGLDKARETGLIPGIFSDGKAQVSVRYENNSPVEVTTVVVSIQHDESKDLEALEHEIRTHVLAKVFDTLPITENTLVLVNPAGPWTVGGPIADTGLTGRKLAVDTYGGLGAHGGGAFSGKDPSKVDRSAAYQARLIAKTIVNARLATEVTVGISYAIGKADPVALTIDTHGTGTVDPVALEAGVREVFALRPAEIIARLELLQTRFASLSTYGHFGNYQGAWERGYEHADALVKAVTAHAR